MAATKKSKHRRPPEKKYKSYGVWDAPCDKVIGERRCNGEIRTRYEKDWEYDPNGHRIPGTYHRKWKCSACGAPMQEPIFDRKLKGPDYMTGEFTQRVAGGGPP